MIFALCNFREDTFVKFGLALGTVPNSCLTHTMPQSKRGRYSSPAASALFFTCSLPDWQNSPDLVG